MGQTNRPLSSRFRNKQPLGLPTRSPSRGRPGGHGRQRDARQTGPASAPPRPALSRPRSPCASPSPWPPVRLAYQPDPGANRQFSDQASQRFRGVAAADPHPVPAYKLDLDMVLGGSCCRGRPVLRDDINGQKTPQSWQWIWPARPPPPSPAPLAGPGTRRAGGR